METRFPPPLNVGNRVWTTYGYYDHGPIEGPRITIKGNMGGTITGTERPYFTMDSLLYTIHWDNGQISKHYSNGLFCIGRFQTRSEFEAAINLTGPVELTLGPQGGFRHVKIVLEYDGEAQNVEVYDRGLWFDCLEALAKNQGAAINITKLPPKQRKKRSS